ncbi:MAG: helix-hairpin-helix domain-containing protein [Ignavibacteria bacterium]|nr:helix-hairpin-helix domain-containing protein [Ignavibacteria bacterium]
MAASEDSLNSLKVIPAEDTNTELVFEVIDINTASKEQLTGLPGVGESTADKIINYRNDKKFSKAEDIMNVKGIGKKKFGKMKNFIKTE